MTEKSLILVATYNEAENIAALLNATLKLKANLDILIVDDSSPDGTGEIVKKFCKNNNRVKLIIRNGNKGRGLAAHRAYEYFHNSNYKYICELDADFQEDPKDVLKLIDKANEDNCDMVIGSRYISGGSFKSDKKWRSLLVNSIILTLFRTKIKDLTCTFHLIKRELFDTIPYSFLRSKGFFFASELHLLAERAGLNVKEIPIYFPRREKGKSKINISVALGFGKDAILFWALGRNKKWKTMKN